MKHKLSLSFYCTCPTGPCRSECVHDGITCSWFEAVGLKALSFAEKPKRDLIAEAKEIDRQATQMRTELKQLMMGD